MNGTSSGSWYVDANVKKNPSVPMWRDVIEMVIAIELLMSQYMQVAEKFIRP